jgi:DNA repair photolyase
MADHARHSGGPGPTPSPIRGRGTPDNPTNRFERLHYAAGDWEGGEEGVEGEEGLGVGRAEHPRRSPRTLYLRDPARKVISYNQSPDIPFDASINPYRGCEHGCIYCYARPTHEYLGFSAGLDFETRILVKEDAPALLHRELSARSWQPQVLALSGVTDPYQPIDRHTQLTRRCLEVLADFRNPVAIITKSSMVTRDIDVLHELDEHDAVGVSVSVTTLDSSLHSVMEPRTSKPRERLRTIERLASAGIPVSVMVAPVVPGLTDHEIPAILEAAAAAGARSAGYIVLRLPLGVASLFQDWLERHYPERATKVLNRLESLRGGRLNDPSFGSRMRGEGVFAEQIRQLFEVSSRRVGLGQRRTQLRADSFRISARHPPLSRATGSTKVENASRRTVPRSGQLSLF